MAFQEKIGVRSVRLALTVLAGTALMAGHALAADEVVQKVEITGSSIKRIAIEGALPVQRLSQEAIARTGAVTVADLIQSLPAMQGFTISATAAGSDSGGQASASIHDLGTDYTLVLLNGRRIAPQGSGTAVNLNAIPMSAVERVEILTDGASALYGSDAIAGVINFILKKNQQGGNVEATYGAPQESGGGKNWNVGATYGFGNLDSDRFNVLMAYRHDEQERIRATDRDFAKSSYVPFSNNGKNYIFDRTSSSAAPANAAIVYNNPKTAGVSFNPYLRNGGSCAEQNFLIPSNNKLCGFDSGSQVEIVPESKRDSLFTKGTYKLTEDLNAFAEVALSRYDLTARIASNPVPIPVSFDPKTKNDLYDNYIKPYLTPTQQQDIKSVTANYRMVDWGPRASQTITETKHLVVGVEGELAGWNIDSGLTWSQNSINERYVGGYAKTAQFNAIAASAAFNPFLPAGASSAAMQALIDGSQFNGSVRTASTTLRGVDAHGSREVFTLPGGAASIGIGADYREYRYEQKPDANANSTTIYNFDAKNAYDLSRETYGVFAELLAPVSKTLELTVAGRVDNVSATKNGMTRTTVGKDETANTYKVSARWQPTQVVLIRGSYGTGFKAPSMLDIAQPLVNAGFTASSYACPYPGTAGCRPSTTQYNELSAGNPDLKPEKSKQFTVGFRIEPSPAFSIGADLWDVKINNAVAQLSESLAFADPVKYANFFTNYKEVTSGNTYYAFKSLSVNLGQKHNRGIDWDMTGRHKFDFGNFTVNLSGTHMLKADYTVPGTSDQWTSNMNFFGATDAVTFRNLMKLNLSLESGKLTNSLIVSYRNGYTDALATVYNIEAAKTEKLRLEVPSYTTFDWQGRYMLNKATTIRAGIKNLFDRAPPLSLRSSTGHQVGFDPRYADPTLRSFYVTGAYKF